MAEPEPIAISLIVCTRNRLAFLEAAIETLRALRCREPWELILVENGSTDGTREWLATLGPVADATVTIVSEPRPGLSNARNAGLARARGRLVAFTDDDCYPTPSYLDSLLDVFADESIGYLGGRVLLHDPLDLPITIKTSLVTERIPPKTYVAAGFIHGANMAFRKEVCDSVGEFDDLVLHAEDVDYVSRASWQGWVGIYSPLPTVRHHHRRRTMDERARLMRGYQCGRGAYHVKCLWGRESRIETLKNLYWKHRKAWPDVAFARELPAELRGAIVYIARRAARLVFST